MHGALVGKGNVHTVTDITSYLLMIADVIGLSETTHRSLAGHSEWKMGCMRVPTTPLPQTKFLLMLYYFGISCFKMLVVLFLFSS